MQSDGRQRVLQGDRQIEAEPAINPSGQKEARRGNWHDAPN
jgi:hypothetical protein